MEVVIRKDKIAENFRVMKLCFSVIVHIYLGFISLIIEKYNLLLL